MAELSSTATLVRDLMTRDVHTVDPNDALLTADRMMELGRIRHLLVVDGDGVLVGVLSQRDLFHNGLLRALGYGSYAAHKAMDDLVVKEVMTSSPLKIEADAPLSRAAATMFKSKIGCLPVVVGDKLVGILTESDFVKLHAD
jgi:CBS domain-containing membrane protein